MTETKQNKNCQNSQQEDVIKNSFLLCDPDIGIKSKGQPWFY